MKRIQALTYLGSGLAVAACPLAVRAADAVHLASMPIDGGAQVWYAQQQGYFATAGLAPQIDSFSNGSAITAGVIGGSIDIGYSAFLTLATAFQRGVPLSIIAPASVYLSKSPISSLMLPVDSPVKSAKDLNGKTIAINGLKNITQLATMAWCDQNGGDYKSLSFVEMGFPEMPQALAQHRVDAAFITEPLVSSAIRTNTARVLARPYDAIAPEFMLSAWFAMQSFTKANPGIVRKVSQILKQSSTWANTHDTESAKTLADLTKLPLAAIDGMTRSRFLVTTSAKSLQPIIDSAVKYGLLAHSFSAADMIDPNAV